MELGAGSIRVVSAIVGHIRELNRERLVGCIDNLPPRGRSGGWFEPYRVGDVGLEGHCRGCKRHQRGECCETDNVCHCKRLLRFLAINQSVIPNRLSGNTFYVTTLYPWYMYRPPTPEIPTFRRQLELQPINFPSEVQSVKLLARVGYCTVLYSRVLRTLDNSTRAYLTLGRLLPTPHY
jgi:hypothetical protein